jgi:hypothetical protein
LATLAYFPYDFERSGGFVVLRGASCAISATFRAVTFNERHDFIGFSGASVMIREEKYGLG